MLRSGRTKQACISIHDKTNTASPVLLRKHDVSPEMPNLIFTEIDNDFSSSEFDFLTELDSKSKLYIHGHGTKDDPEHIYNDHQQKIHYTDLAKNLAARLLQPSLKLSNTASQYLTISLVMCESVGFGERLHHELSKYGIYCTVSTRVFPLYVDPRNGQKKTLSRGTSAQQFAKIQRLLDSTNRTDKMRGALLAQHHNVYKQTASKVVFYWNDEHQQMKQDGYRKKWKNSIYTRLKKVMNDREKFPLALLMRDLAHDDDPKKITALLKKARAGEKYQFVFENPATNIALITLTNIIEEGEEIVRLRDTEPLLNDDQPCYRYFEEANLDKEQLIAKAINDCLIECRDTMQNPANRLQGLNQLLIDVNAESSIKGKLKKIKTALTDKTDPYHLNEFAKNTFMTFSLFSPFSTRIYSAIEVMYKQCQKDLEIAVTAAKEKNNFSLAS